MWWSVSASALAGVLTWTFLEYIIHRFLGHHRRLLRNPFGVEHTAHHSRGNYFSPTWKKCLCATGAIAVFVGPAVWALGLLSGATFTISLVGAYAAYEILHRQEHRTEGLGPYGRWARHHHFYHHFHDPKCNHGVTSPLWDLVFGTYVRPGVIRVPEKLAMTWLRDPQTGEFRQHLATRYTIRRNRGAA